MPTWRSGSPSRSASSIARRCSRPSRLREGAERQRRRVRELLPSDKKMGEAIDLYATLFPKDPEIPNILLKNGQLFYEHGEYDEAVKRFGKIVEAYPKDRWRRRRATRSSSRSTRPRTTKTSSQLGAAAAEGAGVSGRGRSGATRQAGHRRRHEGGRGEGRDRSAGRGRDYLRRGGRVSARRGRPGADERGQHLRARRQARGGGQGLRHDCRQVSATGEAPQAAWAAGKLYEQAALWDQASRYYQLLADR